jgi:hypothetical protein
VPLKTSTHYNISQRSENPSPTIFKEEDEEQVLNIWDARVHCAVLKQRTTRRHPARLPQPAEAPTSTRRHHQEPQPTTRTVHTSPRPVSIKTTNPHQTAGRPIASGPNSVLANQNQPLPTSFPPPARRPSDPKAVRPEGHEACTHQPAPTEPVLLVNVPPMSNHQTLKRRLRWSA